MTKKRKTRQQKIIARLRRQLVLDTLPKARQEAISIEPKISLREQPPARKQDDTIFSYNPHLVRKDIFKTLILTLIVISFEFMLYLKLR